MRALQALVVGMGVLIVAGTVTLVVLLVKRAGGPAGSAPNTSLDLPAGSRIMGIAGVDGRLAVWLDGPEGSRILLLDGTGRRVGELRAR